MNLAHADYYESKNKFGHKFVGVAEANESIHCADLS